MPKVLITGCSSGFGLETAKLFIEKGWDVIATMRTPREGLLPLSDRLRLIKLDITDPASIAQAAEAAGAVDVLVNNAGFGAPAPVELTDPETIYALFQTNAVGTLAMIQAFVPQMRHRRSGVVINVTSTVTLKTLPIVGVYRASKAAVNAFTESLAMEVKPFGVRVHIVLPGRSPETRFGDNARPHIRGIDDPDYAPVFEQFVKNVQQDNGPVTHASDVAEAVWQAATDSTASLYIPAGEDAEQWMAESSIHRE
ncbi:short-chain dehydrogenase/reductase [Mangrovibacter phragmitis]|uniref:Short-chain dehydrogenase/reductase n=1 Tax=Mangrovibacter phragmitis TaxID=1691903 RepID=A0A1B7L6I2_9ENTR|nr:SDR family oxidoreductase [Mangrovibacter phragmitis]OAT77943.1 short-chain dehydrogenase/reductase [Mangrovibacter phragmitis]